MKKKKTLIIAICAVVLVAVVVAIILIVNGKKGYRQVNIADVQGVASIARDNKEPFDAVTGMKLQSNDEVQVKENSTLLLLVDEDKHIAAEANTKFKLEATGSVKKGNVEITLLEGKALFTIDEKLPEGSEFKVTTSNATMCVRGTKFAVTYDPVTDTTTLEVFEGVVNTTYEDGTEEDVTPGENRVFTAGVAYAGATMKEALIAAGLASASDEGEDGTDITAVIDGGFIPGAGGTYAPVNGSALAQYNNIVTHMDSYVAQIKGYGLQESYSQYDYMLHDYDLDGEKEVILYLRYYNEDDVYMLDLCFLDYTDELGVYVRTVNTNDVDESCYYADLGGLLVRYSWRTSPYESYLYSIRILDDGRLCYVLEDSFDEILTDFEITGQPLALYGSWEMILEDMMTIKDM